MPAHEEKRRFALFTPKSMLVKGLASQASLIHTAGCIASPAHEGRVWGLSTDFSGTAAMCAEPIRLQWSHDSVECRMECARNAHSSQLCQFYTCGLRCLLVESRASIARYSHASLAKLGAVTKGN